MTFDSQEQKAIILKALSELATPILQTIKLATAGKIIAPKKKVDKS